MVLGFETRGPQIFAKLENGGPEVDMQMWRRRADMAPESALPLFVPFIPYTDRFRVSLETWNVDNPYRHSAQRTRDPETADT